MLLKIQVTERTTEVVNTETTSDIVIDSLSKRELHRVLLNTPSLFINKLRQYKNISIDEEEIHLGYCFPYAMFLISQLPERYRDISTIHIIPGCHAFIELNNKCYDSYPMYDVNVDNVENFIEEYFECEMEEFDNQHIVIEKDRFITDEKEIFELVNKEDYENFIKG